ncbi:hypothetical protein Q7M_1218 (plasmid) [Borrelia crocidurae str. Achema]|uniref:Uncharacterized protein n=1 Tax=Borrelia crocidurae (strain Achema) TaxID=1155096 RepID=I0FER9_BORCA|nr:hypothetical protein Q7M_1218 [Borrelia crocidurae str. Achema]
MIRKIEYNYKFFYKKVGEESLAYVWLSFLFIVKQIKSRNRQEYSMIKNEIKCKN